MQSGTDIAITPAVATAGGPDSKPRTLRQATQEFESLFIAQMLGAMRQTVPQSHLFGTDSGERVFRQMLDEETARQVASSGGLGIGDLLYRQLAGVAASQPQEAEGDNNNASRIDHKR